MTKPWIRFLQKKIFSTLNLEECLKIMPDFCIQRYEFKMPLVFRDMITFF